MIQYLFSSELIEAFGWTIVHSLWQGVVVAIVLVVLLLLLYRNSAQIKYFVSFVSLAIMLCWSAVTFNQSFKYACKKAQLREQLIASPNYFQSLLLQGNKNENGEIRSKNRDIDFKMIAIRSFFQRNFAIICTVWVVGMVLLSLRLVGGFVYLRKIRTQNLVAIDNIWLEKLETYMQRLQIRKKVNLFLSPLATVPLTIGTFKPIILLPISTFSGLSTKEIEAILAHELAHILRNDYLFNIFQSVIEIIFFYHPVVWLISGQIRRERENSCDNLAVQLTGDKISLAKALVAVQQNYASEAQIAMSFASPQTSVYKRIKRLNKKMSMKTNFFEGVVASGVIAMGLVLASFTIDSQKLENTESANRNMAHANVLSDTVVVDNNIAAINVDSLMDEIKQKAEKSAITSQHSSELNEIIEVAMSESNQAVTAEILQEVNNAIDEMDILKIVQAAMSEAAKAINEANEEIEKEDINGEMREAAAEIDEARAELKRDLEKDTIGLSEVEKEAIKQGYAAASAGLDMASAILNNLNVEAIVGASLNGAGVALNALGSVDLDSVQRDSNLSEDALKSKKAMIKQREIQLKEAEKQLEKDKKQLEKQLKELEK